MEHATAQRGAQCKLGMHLVEFMIANHTPQCTFSGQPGVDQWASWYLVSQPPYVLTEVAQWYTIGAVSSTLNLDCVPTAFWESITCPVIEQYMTA